jgi:hypothetical protein
MTDAHYGRPEDDHMHAVEAGEGPEGQAEGENRLRSE